MRIRLIPLCMFGQFIDGIHGVMGKGVLFVGEIVVGVYALLCVGVDGGVDGPV